MLSGWRIADPSFSQDVEMMMSGEGAYLFGGRWNSKGVRVVYLGTSLAQAAMELLVHINGASILRGFNKMEVRFPESVVQHIDAAKLPADWATPSMTSQVQSVGDKWVLDGSSLILQVPSAAIWGEYNFLLNPAHPDLGKADFGPITGFSFDPRLQKEV